VISARVPGVGLAAVAQQFGVTVQEAQQFIQGVCANAAENSTPPRCEVGQQAAADAAFDRGDLGQYLFHLGAIFACFLGTHPGPPL
jgi:hypothetical protein